MQKGSKITKIILTIALVLVLLGVGTYLLLFRINRFGLEIRMLGQEDIQLAVGDAYEEAGAEVYLAGTLFWKEGIPVNAEIKVTKDLDTAVPGDYAVTYEAVYQTLSACRNRWVHVLDVEAPVISLDYIPGAYTFEGAEYTEEGYSAWDAIDGDITHLVTRTEQDGQMIYTVSDKAGNTAMATRQITYKDATVPVLTLEGGDTVTVLAGEGYTEPGWSALDYTDGDISDQVKVTGTIDRYLAGTYTITYTIQNSLGNTVQMERNVVVQARERPETVEPEGNVIYLTFDDGPGAYTQKLLEVLAKYDVKVTFFVRYTDYMDVIKDIVDQGHSIGVHCTDHNYYKLYASKEGYFADLLGMQQLIYDKTGVKTYLMRFPGGSANTVSRFNRGIMTYLTQAVQDMGFQYHDWNVNSDDAGESLTSDKVYGNVVSGIRRQQISIVLQHDLKGYSVQAVERIIQWGLANGYRFEAMDMTTPPVHKPVSN